MRYVAQIVRKICWEDSVVGSKVRVRVRKSSFCMASSEDSEPILTENKPSESSQELFHLVRFSELVRSSLRGVVSPDEG
jgi:hypothetical protein